MRRFCLVLLLCALPAASLAQSGLGVSRGDLRLGYDDGDGAGGFASGRVDVAITSAHGLQGDLGLEDTASGRIGTLAGHLYLAPAPGLKYGLFGYAGDVDDRSATFGGVGAEGMLAVGPQSAVEMRAGLGLTAGDLDFLFAGGAVYHDLTPALTLRAGGMAAHYDEAAFEATGYAFWAGVDLSRQGGPLGLFAEIGRDGLEGPDGAPWRTTVRAGLRITFGRATDRSPERRLFRTPDPLRPLTGRGLF